MEDLVSSTSGGHQCCVPERAAEASSTEHEAAKDLIKEENAEFLGDRSRERDPRAAREGRQPVPAAPRRAEAARPSARELHGREGRELLASSR